MRRTAAVSLALIAFSMATAAAQYCQHSSSRSAFLKDIVDGMHAPMQDQLCSTSNSSFVVHPDDTGITHFVLPGFIPKHLLGSDNQAWRLVPQGSTSEPDEGQAAVLHLWLRAACIGSVTTVRGFGMLQGSAEARESIHGQFEMDIQLHSLPGMPLQRHAFRLHWRAEEEGARFHAPFTIETSFPAEDTQSHYRVLIGGFHELAPAIFPTAVSSCHQPVTREQPVLLTVITNSYTDSLSALEHSLNGQRGMELVAQVLTAHVNHHVKLGLAGTVHYEIEPYLSYLASHSGIQALIQEGSLRLIRWGLELQLETAFGMLLTHDVWFKDRSKVLQYNHAMLAHWGMDVYINPLDIDEFVATNSPTNVSQLIANGCIMPQGHTTDLRFDIRCGSCHTVEGNLWLSPHHSNPLTHYNETDWRPRLRGKPIFHVDNTFSMAIHEAGVFDADKDHFADPNCFYHLHMVNLFSSRRNATDIEGFTADNRWTWML